MIRHLLTVTLLTILAACGGGGSTDVAAHKVARTDVLVLGNSITRHPPLLDVGWTGDWGMAASAPERDFAHLVASGLGLPLTARNVATLEVDPAGPLPDVAVTPGTVVIVELGDNGLPVRYAELLRLVKNGAALVCTSTYWVKTTRDDVMRPTCEAAGGTWVDLGGIYTGPQGNWTNRDVAGHPGDKEMAVIAARILEVL